MLTASGNGRRIEAAAAVRGDAFTCPGCLTAVILKRGPIKVAHFAHKPPTNCDYAVGETLAHLQAKQWMVNGLRAAGYNAQLEVPLGPNRADVLAISNGHRLAFELQHTNINLLDIEHRAGSYAANGIAQIWLPFIHRSINLKHADRDGSTFVIQRYPARPFEKWVHGFNRGMLWLYDPHAQALYRGRFHPCTIEVEAKEWQTGWDQGEPTYDSAGGYSYNSKRWRTLRINGPYQVADLVISITHRAPYALHNYHWPAAPIGILRLRSENTLRKDSN